MRKLTLLPLCLLLALLCACSAGKLADAFDEETVKDAAKETVQTINTRNYDAVISLLREDLQDQVTADQLRDAWDKSLSADGAFVEYTSVSVAGTRDKNTDEDYAVAVLACNYENGSQTFTLSFDTDYALVGLYMK